MSISVRCTGCGTSYRVKMELAGRRVQCPKCQGIMNVSRDEGHVAPQQIQHPKPASPPPGMAQNPSSADENKTCPYCGEQIKAVAKKCRFCGTMLDHSVAPADNAMVEDQVKRRMREKQDNETALVLLITGILGCFSPVCAVYGTIFLVRRPYAFPRKGLALAGTTIHWIWTVLLVIAFAARAVQ